MSQTPKLVMTLLVRNELDIIESNIRFHLNHGVDHIVATDNGSIDGTLDVLKKYQDLGVLTLIQEPNQTYEQSKWVSRMASLAIDQHQATHLFHADADEFFYPQLGSLKKTLPDTKEVLYIQRYNFVPTLGAAAEGYKHFKYLVHHPIDPTTFTFEELIQELPFIRIGPKILTSSYFTQIAQGNHGIETQEDIQKTQVDGVKIYHFPIRSYAQFERKVVEGTESYDRGPHAKTNYGGHWRGWYKLYKKGKLSHYYNQVFSESNLHALVQDGVLMRTAVPLGIRYVDHFYKYQNVINSFFKRLSVR